MEKKSNFCVSRTWLCTQKITFRLQSFFIGECLFDGWNKQQTNFGGNFKIIRCRHQKNISHTIYIYMIRLFWHIFFLFPYKDTSIFMSKQEIFFF